MDVGNETFSEYSRMLSVRRFATFGGIDGFLHDLIGEGANSMILSKVE